MPSILDPFQVVDPGNGKLPADTVPANSLLFPPGGGSDAALQAHIINPLDAHMASAIGMNPYDTLGNPILWDVGGPVDGESVLDFIASMKDLIPITPNVLGLNLPEGINSGVPNWGTLEPVGFGGTAITGAYANGATTVPTHFVVPSGTATFNITGMVYPADRGVLAIYKNTDGNYFNAGATTLFGALSLGPYAPAGIPDAAFDNSIRTGQQLDYTAPNAGIDVINLTWRLPYLRNYAAYPGAPYSDYGTNFYRFQLATFTLVAGAGIGVADSQNWLVVHWRESFATSLAAIGPANLTLANLVAANCYSATPTAGNFDDNTAGIYNLNRHNIFRDMGSAIAPGPINAFTTSGNAGPTTSVLSGVTFINDTTLTFNAAISALNIFNLHFQTGTVASPPDVPAQFESPRDPMVVYFTEFGGTSLKVPYYDLRKFGIPGNYSIVNAPQPADTGEYVNAALAITSPTSYYTPNNAVGYSKLTVDLFRGFTANLALADASKQYLYNTFPTTAGQPGSSTTTFESFVDEHKRYLSTHTPAAIDQIVPTVLVKYVSATSLVVDTDSLQVLAHNLRYPADNFAAATYHPTGPNYSGLPGGDGVNHMRRHLRAFDTGIPKNTGTLRIRFLAGYGTQASFTVDALYDGTETTGHITGGMIIQVRVPGLTGWLDIGRAFGDPGVGVANYYGGSTGVSVVGPDIYVTFNTTAWTAANGFGEFPLFVRVTMLNNAAGRAIRLDEIEWLP